MLAFSPLFWQYAISAEVFALNNFFVALIIYICVEISFDARISLVRLGAFVCGLALCNQHTIVLFEAPLIVWVLWNARSHIANGDSRYFWQPAAAFILGLSVYAYLPLAAVLSPQPGAWGDVATLTGFLHHLLRRDYGTFQLYSGRDICCWGMSLTMKNRWSSERRVKREAVRLLPGSYTEVHVRILS
jgi:hypothetical protein